MQIRPSFLAAMSQASFRFFLRRPKCTSKRRRRRRTDARSIESTSRPSGNIQKPRIGRNPSNPAMQRAIPTVIRKGRDDGIGTEKRPMLSRRLPAGDAGSGLFTLPIQGCEFHIAIGPPLR
jgi:hypothetical protein